METGLEDRAVTRDLRWGIKVPLPGYENKVLYVWFDAPIGYISSTVEWAANIGQPEKWREYWQDEQTRLIHFIGKDNIVFHAIIWPLILMGQEEYVLPADIPANEFLNLEGNKLSTSKNYAVWLDEYLKKFPPDPLRYCLAVNAPETKDADFSWKDFQARNNNELADILGNFINRTLIFIQKNFAGVIPDAGTLDKQDQEMLARVQQAPAKIGNYLEKFEVRKAITEFMDLARSANKYFNDQTPWNTFRSDQQKCATTLNVCARVCKSLAILMAPFIPFSAAELWQILNLQGAVDQQHWNDAGNPDFSHGHSLNEIKILFSKIEDETMEEEINKLKKISEQAPRKEKQEEPATPLLSYDDFQKIELRVAKVLAAEKVEKADKLLKLTVEIGAETRQIVAGIAQHYTPEQMIGRKIIVVANLEPAKIRGIESRGMLLAARSAQHNDLALLTIDKDFESGIKIS